MTMTLAPDPFPFSPHAVKAPPSAAPGSPSNLLQKAAHPLKVLALGDSLVYGYGDWSGGGWVDRLRRQWMRPDPAGPVLYNLGVRGDKAQQVLERLEGEFMSRGELRNRTPDRLILSVGTNDTPRVGRPDGRLMTARGEFVSAIADLLDRAQGFCPTVFVGMVPVVPERMPFMGCLYYNHADQFDYKEITRRSCEVRGIPYLDCFDLWMGRGMDWIAARMGEDGLHPNELGYESLLADISAWDAIAAFGQGTATVQRQVA